MKKAILLAILIASLTTVNSQVYFGASFGAGTTGKSVAGAATLGIDINHWLIQSGFHNQLNPKQPTLYRLTAGRGFEVGESGYFNFSGGMGRLDQHVEKGVIITGKGTWVGTIEYGKYFRDNGQWFVDVTQAGKFNFVTVGLKFIFMRSNTNGCPASIVR